MKLITLLAGMVALLSLGETSPIQDSKAAPPTAAKGDVESVDSIVKALYDVISGPAGKARDWARFRSLFAPKAQLVAVTTKRSVVMTPDDYATQAGPNLETNGFFEREIARKLDAYGDIAHAFSTYESRHAADDPKPFARGINSIQLLKSKDRWWVVSVFWCEENDTRPLPAEYLPR
jgi:hypothetical protein